MGWGEVPKPTCPCVIISPQTTPKNKKTPKVGQCPSPKMRSDAPECTRLNDLGSAYTNIPPLLRSLLYGLLTSSEGIFGRILYILYITKDVYIDFL